jgi:mono/diheme cytochrome c family protein
MSGLRLGLALSLLALSPAAARAYPGGTPDYQTDVAPFCASCHASADASSLSGAPPDRASKELAANKHIAQIKSGAANTGYQTMSQVDRDLLAQQIEALDKASTVELQAPASLNPGQKFKVTVIVHGGGGPVAGIALVDTDQRWWARSAPAAGWNVVDAPEIRGPDGKQQTKWLEKRPASLGRNISYVNVEGISSDPANDKFASAQTVFTLTAPQTPGTYPLAAAYFYGTELASPLGTKIDPKDPLQRKMPVGGFGGASGRIRFSPVKQIQVAP